MNLVYSVLFIIVVSYLIVPAFIMFMWGAVALIAMVFIILAASGMKYVIEKSYELLFGV